METSPASLTLASRRMNEWAQPRDAGAVPVVEHSYLSLPEDRAKLRHVCPGVLKNELVICKQIRKSKLADEAAQVWTRDKTF